ncbi:hypothetical protein ES707_09774 [subsurface metagenome]
MRGFNQVEAYSNTLKSNLGRLVSFCPADQVARRPNFLDINGDSWLNETEHPLWDVFWVKYPCRSEKRSL